MNAEIEQLGFKPWNSPQPHVVILGAGASKAAFLKGDGNGKLLPLMNDLPIILGDDWKRLVKDSHAPDEDFETQFSWIKTNGNFKEQLSLIEFTIGRYFQSLELPQQPTIYDHLVLGLRRQDVIATFNWDPLLLMAHKRNRNVGTLPDIRFLHGCVSFATCLDHDVLGSPAEDCPQCGKTLVGGKMLFPDGQKDYAEDAVIQRDWNEVGKKLSEAFHLTIFGYAGPASDFKAKELLLQSWVEAPLRDLSHVEIINTEDSAKSRERWAKFIPYQHDMLFSTFWESSIAKFPRRTAEWKLQASINGIPSDEIGPCEAASLTELQAWYSRLAREEIKQLKH